MSERRFFPGTQFEHPDGNITFPTPWADYASVTLPRTQREMYDVCDFVFHANSPVRETARRVLAYFITEAEFRKTGGEPLPEDEAIDFKTYASGSLGLNSELQRWGLDYLAYGNLYLSVFEGFTRSVSCPRCHKEGRLTSVPIAEFINTPSYQFRWVAPKVTGKCPDKRCKYSGDWDVQDLRSLDPNNVFVKLWSPRQIEVVSAENSKRRDYYWRIPAEYRADVSRGNPIFLESEPWEFIEAACARQDIKFEQDGIFHAAEPTLSGVDSRGVGISRTLINYRQAWLWQLLYRQIEAVVAGFVVPVRVITPEPDAGAASQESPDPLLMVDGSALRAQLTRALKMKEIDPLQWHFLPVPVRASVLGGDARNLIPVDILEQATAMLLNGFGFPVDMFKMTLQSQAAIPAIRMFVALWQPLVRVLDNASTWVMNKVADLAQWPSVSVKMRSPTWVDDIQKQMAILQLAQTGQVSVLTALESIGVDGKQELTKQTDYELEKLRVKQVLDDKLKSKEFSDQLVAPAQPPADGQPAAGGAAPQQGGGQPAEGGNQMQGAAGVGGGMSALATVLSPNFRAPGSIDEMSQLAAAVANELNSAEVVAQPGLRQSKMMEINKKSPELHAMVKSQLSRIDNQLKTMGKNQLLQQGAGQQVRQA